MASITDVVFDFCGVLFDWQPAHALKGVFPASIVGGFSSFGDRAGFLYFDDLLDGGADFYATVARYEAERGPELARAFRYYYDHAEDSLLGWLPGMRRVVEDLRAAGVRTWGLTNWSRYRADAFAKRFPELEGLLDGVLVSGIEGVRKPDPAVFRLAEERFSLDPSRTVFLDDNSLNAAAATGAGWQGIAFVDAAHTRRALMELGVNLPEVSASEDAAPLQPAGGAPLDVVGGEAADAEVEFEISPLGGEEGKSEWRAVALGDLIFPSLGADPLDGWNEETFWLSRYKEYRGLGWSGIDWPSVRASLSGAARQLAGVSETAPVLTLTAAGFDERMFMEMWLGYSDPPVRVVPEGDGRYRIVYGEHRICALADFPMCDRDLALMQIGSGGFTPEPPLAFDTLIPVLVEYA